MTTLEDAWDSQKYWAERSNEAAMCLLDLHRRVEALRRTPMATTDDILDLHRRVEALEARAAAEESSAPDVDSALLRTGMVTARHLATIKESLRVEPAPAPAADRPLWEVVAQARYNSDGARMASVRLATAAEIDAMAEWLDARGCMDAGDLLRAEAQRAREGA